MPVAKVLLVEDHPVFSKGLVFLIESQSLFKVIGEARDCKEAKQILQEQHPDIIILDLNLKGENGLDLIKDLKTKNTQIPILVLSMYEERYYAERVIKAGARGYIMKAEAGEKILEAIRAVLAGKVWLSEAEKERLSEYDVKTASLTALQSDSLPLSKLSDREFEIFTLIGKGLGTIEIANRLNISTKTIDTHKEHIKEKLHCGSSQELRQLAVEWQSKIQLD
uniref:Response regulator transcription factor n=1 Tax=Gracilinema caldarium TaxID=215591 RepID=A0A7C3HZP2_9SPIR